MLGALYSTMTSGWPVRSPTTVSQRRAMPFCVSDTSLPISAAGNCFSVMSQLTKCCRTHSSGVSATQRSRSRSQMAHEPSSRFFTLYSYSGKFNSTIVISRSNNRNYYEQQKQHSN